MAIAKNDALSNHSAVATPHSCTISPARTGPAALMTAKTTLISALPARSAPCGVSTAAIAPRESPRPVSASRPSTKASASTAGSENMPAIDARAAKAPASRM